MAVDFKLAMTKKSNEELESYLSNIGAYREEIVRAAIDELEKRGRVFTPEEAQQYENEICKRNETTGKCTIKVRGSMEKHVVTKDDPSLPLFFSKRAVFLFTFFMNPLFGSILLTINCSKTEKKKGIIPVLFFGIGAILILLLLALRCSSLVFSLSYLVINIAGAIILAHGLWQAFIGKETKYRKRKVTVPLIIALALTALQFIMLARTGYFSI